MKCLGFPQTAAKFALVAALILATTLSYASSWTQTGGMRSPRDSHTAVLLPNGNVLAAGGSNNNVALNSAEIYNSANGTWSPTGSMSTGRVSARSILLANGNVLIMGGCTSDCTSSTTATAEIYNPPSGVWTSTGSMARGRAEFVAALLPSGKVLVAGGCTSYNAKGCLSVTASAEIYDPTSGVWKSTGAMRAARMSTTATLLPNGKVLIAGGQTAANDALGSSELYNPATGAFALTSKLLTPRSAHTATLLPNGLVLMAGGENVNGISISKAELYNPATGLYTATGSMPGTRQEHTALLLANGYVMVSGGNRATLSSTSVLSSCALYNPSAGTWATTTSMKSARADHSSTLLGNGKVLDAGGSNANNELSSAELYTP